MINAQESPVTRLTAVDPNGELWVCSTDNPERVALDEQLTKDT